MVYVVSRSIVLRREESSVYQLNPVYRGIQCTVESCVQRNPVYRGIQCTEESRVSRNPVYISWSRSSTMNCEALVSIYQQLPTLGGGGGGGKQGVSHYTTKSVV